jgi:hypothetical protein
MPEFIRENVSNQLKNVQPVSKKTVEYSEEERKKAFPRIFELKNDHVMDWNDNAEPPEWFLI